MPHDVCNRAEYCSSSQPSCVESQKTIPREEQCSEWWQLKGNKPIIKTSKVAMGEASIPDTLITPQQTSVTTLQPGAHQESFFSAFFLNYWNFTIFSLPRSLRASYKDVICREWPFVAVCFNPFGREYYFIIHLQRHISSVLVFQIAVQLLPSWVSTLQEMHLNALKLSVKNFQKKKKSV